MASESSPTTGETKDDQANGQKLELGQSEESAVNILKRNTGGGERKKKNKKRKGGKHGRSRHSKQPDYDGWKCDPTIYKEQVEEVIENLKSGSFPKAFHIDRVAVQETPLVDSKADSLIRVVQKKRLERLGKEGSKKKARAIYAYTPPLLVVGGTGPIGNVNLKQEYPPDDMMTIKRVVTLSTWLPPEIKDFLNKVCHFNCGLLINLFKESLVEVAEKVDHFLFDSPNFAKDATATAIEFAEAKAKDGDSRESIMQAAFELFRRVKDTPKASYRPIYIDDPNHPGEFLIRVRIPVFNFDTESGKTKPAKKGLHAFWNEFNDKIKAESLIFKDKNEKDLIFAEFVRDSMVADGYTYSGMAYENMTTTLTNKNPRDHRFPNFEVGLIRRGALVQIPIGVKGVCAGAYYGSSLTGLPRFKVLKVWNLGDIDMVNEEFLSRMDYNEDMESLMIGHDIEPKPADTKDLRGSSRDSFSSAFGYNDSPVKQNEDRKRKRNPKEGDLTFEEFSQASSRQDPMSDVDSGSDSDSDSDSDSESDSDGEGQDEVANKTLLNVNPVEDVNLGEKMTNGKSEEGATTDSFSKTEEESQPPRKKPRIVIPVLKKK